MDIEREIFQEKETSEPYPWRRFFARGVDIAIYSLLWSIITYLVFRWNPIQNGVLSYLNSFVYYGMMIMIEPLLLSTWGTTVGKAIMGIIIRNGDGSKLSYQDARRRTFGVFSNGYGFNIPIYDLVRLYKCYIACKDGKEMVWDEDCCYHVKDRKLYRIVGLIAMEVLIFGLSFYVDVQATIPLHRGPLTPKEYYANCNEVMGDSDINLGMYINDHGEWEELPSIDGHFFVTFDSMPPPKHELIVKDGIVTGVRLEASSEVDDYVNGLGIHMYIAYMAFCATQKGLGFRMINNSSLMEEIEKEFVNYSITENGFRITNTVEFRGYATSSLDILVPIEGEEHYYHAVFSIEKIED